MPILRTSPIEGIEPPIDDDLDPVDRRYSSWTTLAKRAAVIVVPLALLSVFLTFGGSEVSAPRPADTLPGPTIRPLPGAEIPRATTADASSAAIGIGESKAIDFVDTDPNTFWVSPDGGNDADNDGQTPDTPWASLQPALERVQPGQTIYLMSGRYTENREPGNAHYVLKTSGTPDAWIRIAAGPGERPVIVASEGNGVSIRGNYVEVSGLEVVGEGFGVDNAYGWGIVVRNAHNVRVIGNQASSMPVGGITAIESGNVEILYNEVHDNSFWGTEQGSGISIWHARDGEDFEPNDDGYNDVILGNRVYRNENKVFSRWRDHDAITDGNGIIVDQTDETGYTGRTLVANNVVFDNGGRGILVLESSRVDVIHNTTYHNGRTPGLEGGPVELAAGRANDVRFFNNLAWPRPGSRATTVSDAQNVVMGGNVLITGDQGGPATDADLVMTADPGLMVPGLDPATADFRPHPTASIAGFGLPTSPRIPVDVLGYPRSETGPTPGAYEIIAP